jgi:hypothetical protein
MTNASSGTRDNIVDADTLTTHMQLVAADRRVLAYDLRYPPVAAALTAGTALTAVAVWLMISGTAGTAAPVAIICATASVLIGAYHLNRTHRAVSADRSRRELRRLNLLFDRDANSAHRRLTSFELAQYDQILRAHIRTGDEPYATVTDTVLRRTAVVDTNWHFRSDCTAGDIINRVGHDELARCAYWWPLTAYAPNGLEPTQRDTTLFTPVPDTLTSGDSKLDGWAPQQTAAAALRTAEHTYGTDTLETARTLIEDGVGTDLGWDELLNLAAVLAPAHL